GASAVGANSSAQFFGTAIGYGAQAGNVATAVGQGTIAADAGAAFGVQAQAGTGGVSVGNNASTAEMSVAVGANSLAGQDFFSQTDAIHTVAVGGEAWATEDGATVVGYNSYAQAVNAVVLGS